MLPRFAGLFGLKQQASRADPGYRQARRQRGVALMLVRPHIAGSRAAAPFPHANRTPVGPAVSTAACLPALVPNVALAVLPPPMRPASWRCAIYQLLDGRPRLQRLARLLVQELLEEDERPRRSRR
jgi:hypothetical protein